MDSLGILLIAFCRFEIEVLIVIYIFRFFEDFLQSAYPNLYIFPGNGGLANQYY